MKVNGEVVHRSTYRGLNQDQKSNQAHILLRKEFDNIIRYNFGTDISPDNYPGVNLEDTPLYEIYQDDTTNAEGGFAGKTKDDEYTTMAARLDSKVPTPELNDNNLNSSVILPRDTVMID